VNTNHSLVISVKECAEALGISKNTAYQLLKAGKIPCIRLNRRLIIPRKRFEAFLNGDSGRTGGLPNE